MTEIDPLEGVKDTRDPRVLAALQALIRDHNALLRARAVPDHLFSLKVGDDGITFDGNGLVQNLRGKNINLEAN